MAKVMTLSGAYDDAFMGAGFSLTRMTKNLAKDVWKGAGAITDNPLVHAGLSAGSVAIGMPGAYNALKASTNTASSVGHSIFRKPGSPSVAIPQSAVGRVSAGSTIARRAIEASRLARQQAQAPSMAPLPPQQTSDNSKLLMVGGLAVVALLLLRKK